MRDAHYRRVSLEEQATKGTSMENQAQKLEAFSSACDACIFADYADPGFSGKDGERPSLKRMLSDAKLRKFDRVVVLKMDRLARKLRLLLDVEEQLRESGVALVSVTESVDTSVPMGRLVFQILGVAAEWEREMIIERTRSGRIQRYQEGRWGPGNPPYGYDYDRESKRLVINKAEASVVKLIFDLCAHKGKSLTAIAHILNDEGIPPRGATRKKSRATVWHKTGVRDIITHPVYKGLHPVHGGKAEVPAIVTEEVWQAAQSRLHGGKHLRSTGINSWLLQGRIQCGLCGHHLRSEISHGRRFYSCRGRLREHHLDESPTCVLPRIPASWLEEQLLSRITSILENPEILGSLLDQAISDLKHRESELEVAIRPVESQLAVIQEKRVKLAEEWVAGTLGAETVANERRRLDSEAERLQSLKAQLDPGMVEELARTRSYLEVWQQARQQLGAGGRPVPAWAWILGKPLKLSRMREGKDPKAWEHQGGSLDDWREILTRLQVELVAFRDRVDVKALFPIDPLRRQLDTPGYRSGHYQQAQ